MTRRRRRFQFKSTDEFAVTVTVVGKFNLREAMERAALTVEDFDSGAWRWVK